VGYRFQTFNIRKLIRHIIAPIWRFPLSYNDRRSSKTKGNIRGVSLPNLQHPLTPPPLSITAYRSQAALRLSQSCSVHYHPTSASSPPPSPAHTSSCTPSPSLDPAPHNADHDVYDARPRTCPLHLHRHAHCVRVCCDASSGFAATKSARRWVRPVAHR